MLHRLRIDPEFTGVSRLSRIPGALPVLNHRAVELATRMAAAVECTIHERSLFARKNYFYPDLPKGYQISQFDQPIATEGKLSIRVSTGEKLIRITRIHIEEDAGKLVHEIPGTATRDEHSSLVDLNRAGVPLIEIVSEPDVRSAEEAIAYLNRLRQILMYTDVCDGNMEEGSLRCDANVSVRRAGEPYGTRAEVKNLNSFRFLGRAIEFETSRQIGLLERGERIVQETRLFDSVAGVTRSMRSKEEAHDYRYFPEPDLLPLIVERDWIEHIRSTIPELPRARAERFEIAFGIAPGDAETLASTRDLAEYFEETARVSGSGRAAANWVKNEVLRVLNDQRLSITEYSVRPDRLGSLIRMVENGAINGKVAKEVFDEMSVTPESPAAIVERRGLGQISDPAAIREVALQIIQSSPMQVEQYRSGREALFGFFVGQLMKATNGKARPELAREILHELLDRVSS
jgi:aspartyl-tRNA(Asn)/glutamyl-tRNA(Gln) amidotransferase subunit B